MGINSLHTIPAISQPINLYYRWSGHWIECTEQRCILGDTQLPRVTKMVSMCISGTYQGQWCPNSPGLKSLPESPNLLINSIIFFCLFFVHQNNTICMASTSWDTHMIGYYADVILLSHSEHQNIHTNFY